MIISCNSQSAQPKTAIQKHPCKKTLTTRNSILFSWRARCTTCKAVGKVSKETIAENFGDNPNVIFKDINIEEPENNEIKDKLEMSGSGLFVYDGNEKIDLTAIAFQKAVSSPENCLKRLLQR